MICCVLQKAQNRIYIKVATYVSFAPYKMRISGADMHKVAPNRNQADLESMENAGKVSGPNSLADVTNSVLSKDNNFIVVNKPPSVRMDGDFNVTLEKLILHWNPLLKDAKSIKWVHQLDFATSGALCVALNRPAAAIASRAFELRETRKVYLAVLQGHVDVSKYVLRESANLAIAGLSGDNASEYDRKRKLGGGTGGSGSGGDGMFNNEVMLSNFRQYFNVLQGLVECSRQSAESTTVQHPYHAQLQRVLADREMSTRFERLAPTSFEAFGQSAVARQSLKRVVKFTGIPCDIREYRKENAKRQQQQQQQQQGVNAADQAADDVRDAPALTESLVRSASKFGDGVGIVTTCSSSSEVGGESTAACTAGDDSHIVRLVESALDPLFDYASEQQRVTAATGAVPAPQPCIYRVSGNDGAAKLVVDVPLADRPDDFRMEPGRSGNPGRTAQTVVEVLQLGRYQGRPVTKVRLTPHSGRRHQLRVHSLCLGHPIVGDYTYNILHRQCIEDEDRWLRDTGGPEHACPVQSAERMMLHAYSLMVPVPSLSTRGAKAVLRDLAADSTILKEVHGPSGNAVVAEGKPRYAPLVDVVTPDPFVFSADGELTPVLPSFYSVPAPPV